MGLPQQFSSRLNDLEKNWDAIIIGGGITGAGIFRELSRMGYHILLLDQADFAFGTSSRSSKLVHGGLRYLANAQFQVTFESVREREHLQKEFPNLVKPLEFLIPIFDRYKHGAAFFNMGLNVYDIFGSKWKHGSYALDELESLYPSLNKQELQSVLYYYDAEVDDSRLVMRVINEGMAFGGKVINYCKAVGLLRDHSEMVRGVHVQDVLTGEEKELFATVIINATGPWTDELRSQVIDESVIRKLRGSHFLISQERLPIHQAFTLFHPRDGRALFIIPWQGTTMVGTTDLDHPSSFEREKPEPFMTKNEMEYLLTAVKTIFPAAAIDESDIISSFAGLRPIVTMGDMAPSKASRTHRIFADKNLFSIAGGKLTTFQRMASDLIQNVLPLLPPQNTSEPSLRDITPIISHKKVDKKTFARFSGIYGQRVVEFLDAALPEELIPLNPSPYCPSEIRWAARHEQVHHLDDLLLRRTRLGLVTEQGSVNILPVIRPILEQELGWDTDKWEKEKTTYLKLWKDCYFLPVS